MIEIHYFYNGTTNPFAIRKSLHHPQLGDHIEFATPFSDKSEVVSVYVVQEVRWRPDKDELYVFLMDCPKHGEQCS